MAAFDTTFLVLLLDPNIQAPIDPETGNPVNHAKERIEHLITTLEQSAAKAVVPTPALSEFLVKAEAASGTYLEIMRSRAVFQIAPFDTRCAVELAAMNAAAKASGDKFLGATDSWQKVKFDRQIVAIAKVSGEDTIYSDDLGVRKFAKANGLKAYGVHDLELPPEDAQKKLNL